MRGIIRNVSVKRLGLAKKMLQRFRLQRYRVTANEYYIVRIVSFVYLGYSKCVLNMLIHPDNARLT